jgi:hypothetical protein
MSYIAKRRPGLSYGPSLALGDFVMARGDLIPTRGAIAEPLVLDVVREITHEDILRLGEAPHVGVPTLQKLRHIHHRQARLLAEGRKVGEVAAIVGCTPQRLVQLQNDPAFQDLVAYYADQLMVTELEDATRLRSKLIDVGEMAVDELQARLENDALRSRMSTRDVQQVAEMAMDRTVAPPKAAPPANVAPTAITINFGTKVGVPQAPEGRTIEATVEDAEDPIDSTSDIL